MDKIVMGLLIFLLVALLGILIFFGGYAIYDSCTKVEVETYIVGCEISQLAYAEETTGRSSSRPNFVMGVRNDDFATTFEISSDTFARYVVGDVVDVLVTVWEHHDGTITYTYQLN